MVLEGATTSDSSFPSSEPLPSSDLDPYAQSTPTPGSSGTDQYLRIYQAFQSSNSSDEDGVSASNPLLVNLGALPHRFSFFGTKPHPQALLKGIQESCSFAANTLQRPLRQEEADALSYHFARSLRIGSYGTPLGVVLGTAIAARGQQVYRFPFWTPMKEGGRFSPDVFGPLKGQAARSAWQLSRMSAYWLVGSIVGQIFMGSYAISVGLAGRTRDPRLSEFIQAIKQRAQSGLGREMQARKTVEETGAARAGEETYDMARQRRGAQDLRHRQEEHERNSAQAANRTRSAEDDASPTGGVFAEEYVGVENEPSMQTDEQARQSEARLASNSQRRGSDASSSVTTSPNGSKPAGSAWERLRQGATSGNSPPASSRSPRGGNLPHDNFGLSSSDQDAQRTKTVSQKEFDARIEQEREGRNFDDRAGSERKW